MERRSKAAGVLQVGQDLTVRAASSREELEEAYRLVYLSFLQRDYITESPVQMRFSIFNALPETVTFVAEVKGETIATVTLVPDTPAGLPMDEVYRYEVQALRDQGRRLAEVTMLADRRHEVRRALPVVMLLMKRVFDYATLVLKANDLCITINPRHETYYRRFLLFQQLGGLKNYASVRNNPALAERLDLDRVRDECEGNERLLGQFYAERTPVATLRKRYVLTPEDMQHFFVELTDTFRRAPAEKINYLRQVFPDCPWDQWLPSPTAAGTAI
jgi:hypothetical protein